jgi:class 3 adenylate cyclase/ActR/RegA family two-component response regulator
MEKTAFIQSYGSGIDLLYVEDDEQIAAQVTPFLSRFFRRIDRACDGAEGLEMFKAQPYALVISDIIMPHMNGIEMCQEIKGLNPDQDILITSAYSDTEYFTQTIRLGIDGYIIKPIDYDQFLDTLYKSLLHIKAKAEQEEQMAALEIMVREKTDKLDDIYRKFDDKVNQKTGEIQAVNEKLYKISQQLSKYFSPQIYDSILTGKQKVGITSKRKKLTVFFSDIQGFTKTTDTLEPEEVTYLLNSYFNEMNTIALRHGATIDKFIGDAILIFFGDPSSQGVQNDAVRCVEMGLEMQQKLHLLRREWTNRGITRPFRIRIGISTGFCTVGNFGSGDRMEYTIIGSTVNLASRLQSSAEPDSIILSEETWLLVKKRFACREKEPISVKGFDKPVVPYEVIEATESDIVEKKYEGFYFFLDFKKLARRKKTIRDFLQKILGKL